MLSAFRAGGAALVLVDDRTGSKEMLPVIKNIGVPCEMSRLEYGDACFEGHGPRGTVCVGIERKKIADMLDCINDARYSGHQLPGMFSMYDKSFLILEGSWSAGGPPFMPGLLIQEYNSGNWGPLKHRSQKVMYSKLYRYLISVQLSGVIVTYSRDLYHTAFNVCEIFQYFQKPWDKHTSLREIQQMNMPALSGKPSLVRRWAAQLEGIGVKHSEDAERVFKKPVDIAKSDELDWMRIPGIGAATARRIVKEIQGWV